MATILIVDDDPTKRMLIATWLKESGYRLVMAEDGDAALGLAYHERFDLAIIDLLLPRKSGYDLVEELREVQRDMKFILWSALYPDALIRSIAQRRDVAHIIPSQRDPADDIAQIVQSALVDQPNPFVDLFPPPHDALPQYLEKIEIAIADLRALSESMK